MGFTVRRRNVTTLKRRNETETLAWFIPSQRIQYFKKTPSMLSHLWQGTLRVTLYKARNLRCSNSGLDRTNEYVVGTHERNYFSPRLWLLKRLSGNCQEWWIAKTERSRGSDIITIIWWSLGIVIWSLRSLWLTWFLRLVRAETVCGTFVQNCASFLQMSTFISLQLYVKMYNLLEIPAESINVTSISLIHDFPLSHWSR